MLVNVAGASEIRNEAIKNGMSSMLVDGMRKVKEGLTTPDEVLRSAYSPETLM